jgi:aerobic-type carbon monoxide dehydrogenase small subunit (CoxS/CutS family)
MRLLPVRPDHDRGRAARREPQADDDQIAEAMSNICRCGTYNRIKAGIKQAAGITG